jgi:uncharacterized membrane protein YidH (DUF202 family)
LALAAGVVAMCAGAAGLIVLRRWLGRFEALEGDDLLAAAERTILAVKVIAWVTGIGFVGCGLWFFHLGHRINQAGRYPPPGMRVVRDTRVRTAGSARAMANAALLAAVVCVAAGTLGVWYFYRVAVEVLSHLPG